MLGCFNTELAQYWTNYTLLVELSMFLFLQLQQFVVLIQHLIIFTQRVEVFIQHFVFFFVGKNYTLLGRNSSPHWAK